MLYKFDEGFIEDEINPITNKPYDDSWIIFCLTDSCEYHIINGGAINSAYTLKVSKNYPDWMMSVYDFIEFQELSGKNVIISISEENLHAAKNFYQGHHYNDNFLRDGEPEVLIHSTTYENWSHIQTDGCLKSWNILKHENELWEDHPIGRILGDPADFSDYIMFSGGAISSEIVVLSKQKGAIIMNQDLQYTPGARLYFDINRIARDGLLIRDGCHLKVKNILPLNPYLLWVADWQNVGLASPTSTQKEFTERSNEKFNELFHGKIQTTF